MTITDIFPVSYTGAGRIRVQFWKTAATPAAPTLAEITAASALDATCYFPAGGLEIAHEQARDDDTRLCDENTRESFGRSTFTVQNFGYIYNPNDASETATPGNLAYHTFKEGESGFFGVRSGPKSDAAIVASQAFTIYSVKFGDRHDPIPTGDNAKFLVTQQLALTRLAFRYKIPSAG